MKLLALLTKDHKECPAQLHCLGLCYVILLIVWPLLPNCASIYILDIIKSTLG